MSEGETVAEFHRIEESRIAARLLKEEYGVAGDLDRVAAVVVERDGDGETAEVIGHDGELLMEVGLPHGGGWDLQIDVRRRILVGAGLSKQEAYAQALREKRFSRAEIADHIGISRSQVNPVLSRVDNKVDRARRLLAELG